MTQVTIGAAIPQLPSGDIERTATYFSECLGFEIAAKYNDQKFLIFKRGASEIHFWQTTTEKEPKTLGSESSCYIRVENIEQLFEEFKLSGARFRYELIKQPRGMLEMQVDDPYMNAIRFGEMAR